MPILDPRGSDDYEMHGRVRESCAVGDECEGNVRWGGRADVGQHAAKRETVLVTSGDG